MSSSLDEVRIAASTPPIPSDVIARFWSKVDVRSPMECWPWLAGTSGDYGMFWYDGRSWFAHRFVLLIRGERLSEGLFACHTCDNPICVNPAHLSVGDITSNAAERTERGRSAARERNGAWGRTAFHGEENPTARLTDEIVRAIRRRYADGGITFKQLGAEFGVGSATAHRIVSRKAWAHIE